MDVWKTHPVYTQYKISSSGIVQHKNKPNPVNPSVTDSGYEKVNIWYNKKAKHVKIHTLVLETFVGSKPEGMQGNHKDGNKRNNNLNNLEWVTQSENMLHGFRKGLFPRSKKLSEEEVKTIREMLRNGDSLSKLAELFNVSKSNISCIKRNKIWKRVLKR